jgi:fatty acid desaturase
VPASRPTKAAPAVGVACTVAPETRTPADEATAAPAELAAQGGFAELAGLVREGGLFERRRGRYAVTIGATTGALVALLGAAVVVGDSWWNLVDAAGLAFVLVQLAFIGHDAGHRQIGSRRRSNDLIGFVVADLLTGMSFTWWLTKHNRHHAHTNAPDKDPDLAPGALVYSSAQAAARGRAGRFLARGQAFFVTPLLFLEGLNLQVASVVSVVKRRDRTAVGEAVLLGAHAAVFFAAPFLVLSPVRAVAFIGVTQGLFGFYLGATFLTNHVGMPSIASGNDLGFLRRQVLSSRNLTPHVLTSFVFGGLDAQIEHHLFPSMPRANLRRARDLVRPFCDEHRVHYAERSLFGAYGDVLGHLRTVGLARPTIGPERSAAAIGATSRPEPGTVPSVPPPGRSRLVTSEAGRPTA